MCVWCATETVEYALKRIFKYRFRVVIVASGATSSVSVLVVFSIVTD